MRLASIHCTKMRLRPGKAPDPVGGTDSAPAKPIAGLRGPLLGGEEGREEEGTGMGMEERGREEGGREGSWNRAADWLIKAGPRL